MINPAVKTSEIAPKGAELILTSVARATDDANKLGSTYLFKLGKDSDRKESDPASEAAEILTSDSQNGKFEKAVVSRIIASAKTLLANLIAKKRKEVEAAKAAKAAKAVKAKVAKAKANKAAKAAGKI